MLKNLKTAFQKWRLLNCTLLRMRVSYFTEWEQITVDLTDILDIGAC